MKLRPKTKVYTDKAIKKYGRRIIQSLIDKYPEEYDKYYNQYATKSTNNPTGKEPSKQEITNYAVYKLTQDHLGELFMVKG